MDVVAIAESTPGPIAINVATYIGYKLGGCLGAVIATVGICLPSFGIMYLVSIFYEQFMEISLVAAAFRGIRICVVCLIASAGLKMLKKMKKTPLNLTLFGVTLAGMTLCTLWEIRVSSVLFIFAAGIVGLMLFFVRSHRKGGAGK
jgi:chromate transporter